MYFEKNLESLKKRNELLYEYITAEDLEWDENKTFVETAKNGETIIGYKLDDGSVRYMNSRYNPTIEAEKFMYDSSDLMEKASLIIIGMGNGDHVREYMRNTTREHTHCLIFEPSIDLFMREMHSLDLVDILEDERIFILVEGMPERCAILYMMMLITNVNFATNKHIAISQYQQLFPTEIKSFLSVIKKRYGEIQVEANTIVKYGEQICYNGIHNMCYLPGCQSGYDYIGKFPKDLPMIVVAAGPSLEKNMHLLKKAKGKALIVVVDTAIKSIIKNGIEPDFIITIDNHKPVELFDVPGIEKIPFLVEVAANTEVLERVKSERIIFYSADLIVWTKMFEAERSSIRHLYAGGSVAIDAMITGIEWGIKTVIMIGQDLMMTGNRHHVGEEEVKDRSKLQRVVELKDIYGNDGYTTNDYYMYIDEIGQLAGRLTNVKFIDATEGGAPKANTEIMTLQEAIDKYCVEEYDLESIINSVPKLFVGDSKNMPYNKMIEMRENLMEAEEIFENGARDCKEAIRILSGTNYDIKRLKKINANIAKVDEYYENFKESVNVLKASASGYYEFANAFYAEEDNEIKEAIRLYKKSGDYYKSMADAVPKVIEIIDSAMDRWNKMYN